MPRRKSSLGQQTASARRAAKIRRTETLEEREHRLSQNTARIRNLREQTVQRVESTWKYTSKSALNYNPNIAYRSDPLVDCGSANIVCSHCKALKWKGESKGMCCQDGKVKLESIREPPEPLLSLLNGQHQLSSTFL